MIAKNAVYHIWRNPADALAPLEISDDTMLARVTHKDIQSVDKDLRDALAGGTGRLPEETGQLLAALNFTLALRRNASKRLTVACAKTLQQWCGGNRLLRPDLLFVLCEAEAILEELAPPRSYEECLRRVQAILRYGHSASAGLNDDGDTKLALAEVGKVISVVRNANRPSRPGHASLVAEAVSARGHLLYRVGRQKEGEASYREALQELSSFDGNPTCVRVTVDILTRLAELRTANGDLAAAAESLDLVVAALSRPHDHEAAPVLVIAALVRAARHALGSGSNARAAASLRTAIGVLRSRVQLTPGGLSSPHGDLVPAGADNGDRPWPILKEHDLQMFTLTNECFMEDIKWWTADRAEYANCRTPSERRLLAILNADRGTVADRLAQVSASLYSLERAERKTLDDLLDERVWQGERDFLACVGILQRLAAQIWERHYVDYAKQGGPLPGSVATLRFHGLLAAEVDLLQTIVRRGQAWLTNVIEAGPDNPDGGTYNTSDPADEFYCELPPDEPVAMQVTAFQTASADAHRSDQWVWEVFYALMDLARGLASPLRRCDMPLKPARHLDYLLGVKPSDSPICGTWYITYKQKHRCDRPACRKKYTSLASDLEAALWVRAEEIAKRRWGKVRSLANPDRLWREARAASDSPQGALKYVDQRLKKAPLKRRPKK